MHQLRKDTSELTRKTLQTRNLINQSWLGLNFVISFLNSTEENRLAYAKYRNYCVKLLQRKKWQYFGNLNLSSITDNNLFWKTVSPLFTEKNGSKNDKRTLLKGDKVLRDHAKIDETFNSFVGNIVNTLNIEKDESIFCDTGGETDR